METVLVITVAVILATTAYYVFRGEETKQIVNEKVNLAFQGKVEEKEGSQVNSSDGEQSNQNKVNPDEEKSFWDQIFGKKADEENEEIATKSQDNDLKSVKVTDKQLLELTDIVYADLELLEDQESADFAELQKILGENITVIDKANEPNGFQAMAVRNDDTGEVIIVFRGSDDQDDWVKQNPSIVLEISGPQNASAESFVKNIIAMEGDRSSIILTGHSLGGFHAQNMAKEFDLPAVTFNAPGLKPNPARNMDKYPLFPPLVIWDGFRSAFNPNMNLLDDIPNSFGANDDQVVNYVIKDDLVGNYGLHYGKTVVLNPGDQAQERNDYLHPNKDNITNIIVNELVTLGIDSLSKEGPKKYVDDFLYDHNHDAFVDEFFKEDGNIAR